MIHGLLTFSGFTDDVLTDEKVKIIVNRTNIKNRMNLDIKV